MSITTRQFILAMETYGAKKMPDMRSPKTHLTVPSFKVGGFVFYHSGDDCIFSIIQIKQEILLQAMRQCGESFPRSYQGIYSIEVMLTLAAMIDNKYSKNFVDGMINEIYQKLLMEMDIHRKVEFPFPSTHLPKMEELCELLPEYSQVVNPFESGIKLKEPVDYLNRIKLRLNDENHTRLFLFTESVETLFLKDTSGWMYHSKCSIQKNQKIGELVIEHNYNDGSDNEFPLDETVLFSYKEDEKKSAEYILEISLKTGLAWENYEKENALPVTEKQMEEMVDCVKTSIQQIRKNIINYILSKN